MSDKKNKTIEVYLSEYDIQDMVVEIHKGIEHYATWTYKTEDGQEIDVKIMLEKLGEENQKK